MTGTDRRGRRTRRSLLARTAAVAVAIVGGAGLIGMTGTASAAPSTNRCEDMGMSGTVLFGSDRGTDASSPAGSGTLSDGNRSWAITINKGWTGTGILVMRQQGQSIEQQSARYVGPTTVRSATGRVATLPQITSWLVCGEPSTARDAAAPQGQAPKNPQAPMAQPGDLADPPPGAAQARPAANQPPVAAQPPSREDGSELPVTGVPAGLLAAAGAVLVAAGAGLLYSARRRWS